MQSERVARKLLSRATIRQ
jgi:hypothetical protein